LIRKIADKEAVLDAHTIKCARSKNQVGGLPGQNR
jgi:hypothetical protein